MKFECVCGTLVLDQTDALPHKAQFVADQDWSSLLETIDELSAQSRARPEENSMAITSALLRFSRIAYQCRECGRIWINDKAGRLHSFAPDSGTTPRDLFTK